MTGLVRSRHENNKKGYHPMNISKTLLTILFALSIFGGSQIAHAGSTRYLLGPSNPVDREDFWKTRDVPAFTFDGNLMKVDLGPIIERVSIKGHKLFQSASDKASGFIMIWVPYQIAAQVRMELSLINEEKQVFFETGFIVDEYWHGDEFNRKYDWREDVLFFPKDSRRRGVYNVVCIGLRNIEIRKAKNVNFTYKVRIELMSGDKTEVFDKTYKMVRSQAKIGLAQRFFSANAG